MTKTCCLDCKRKPCPVGFNCRDHKIMWFCVKGIDPKASTEECLGDCDSFDDHEEDFYKEHDSEISA